jgi:hypothetical protein
VGRSVIDAQDKYGGSPNRHLKGRPDTETRHDDGTERDPGLSTYAVLIPGLVGGMEARRIALLSAELS